VHGFDLSWLIPQRSAASTTEEITESIGVFDLTDETRTVLDAAPDPVTRAALAINAPEYLLT
jgi:hypothetical protein